MMIRILFGIQNEGKDTIWDSEEMYCIAETINKLLNINLECNDSIVYGDYFAESNDNEIVYLHTNELIDDEGLLERDFSEYAFLLYINGVEDYPEYITAIETRPDIFVKLRTTEVPD